MTDEEKANKRCSELLRSDAGYNGISYQEFWQDGYKTGQTERVTETEDDAMITRKISDGIKANWVLYFDTWEKCELWCNRHNL